MSLSSERGRSFELKVEKLTRRILQLEIKRDKQSGAGIHKQDIRDRYNQLPLFIECKDHETIQPKSWWRTANAKASFGQAPVVVFPDNEEVLCVMRYEDVLQFVKEVHDYRVTVERSPFPPPPILPPPILDTYRLEQLVNGKTGAGAGTCAYGHIADADGYCLTKKCPDSRGYKKPKEKKR